MYDKNSIFILKDSREVEPSNNFLIVK